jgi:hypothetical protein
MGDGATQKQALVGGIYGYDLLILLNLLLKVQTHPSSLCALSVPAILCPLSSGQGQTTADGE